MTGPAPLLLAGSLLAVDLGEFDEITTEVLVVGAGIAGLSVARSLDGLRDVLVVAKGPDGRGSTLMAQGGVAASIDPADSPILHELDTIIAGAGLCDEPAVRVLVEEAPAAIEFLQQAGVQLDAEADQPALTIEGGHSRRRVVHAGGDATGSELVRALCEALTGGSTRFVYDTFLVDLLADPNGRIGGALVLRGDQLQIIRAAAVVLASGGCGRLYANTTSPPACSGDGTAAALRAGAQIADLEFVQFHPTALYTPADPRPLISESLRGEGAILRDADGEPVMAGVHPSGDLAPRDIVSRAMVAHMSAQGTDHLYLDATAVDLDLAARFPTISAACRAIGVDPARDWIPVSPACHYTMGGIHTDLDGRASLDGLFAVGETAASGVHGANRLASNSLVEGVVFGRRVATVLKDPLPKRSEVALRVAGTAVRTASDETSEVGVGGQLLARVRAAMVEDAGVIRSATGLGHLSEALEIENTVASASRCEADFATINVLTLARVLTEAATRRRESRGAHYRNDFPEPSALWQVHQLFRRNADGELEVQIRPAITAPSPAEAPGAS